MVSQLYAFSSVSGSCISKPSCSFSLNSTWFAYHSIFIKLLKTTLISTYGNSNLIGSEVWLLWKLFLFYGTWSKGCYIAMSVHAVVQVYAWLDWFVFDQDNLHRQITQVRDLPQSSADHSGNDIKYPCHVLGIALMLLIRSCTLWSRVQWHWPIQCSWPVQHVRKVKACNSVQFRSPLTAEQSVVHDKKSTTVW